LTPEQLSAITQAVLDKVKREIPAMSTQYGTVVSSQAQPANTTSFPILSVVIDGDPPTNVTPVISIIGSQDPNTRVLVLYTPPRGAIALATVGEKCDVDPIPFTAFGVVTSTPSPPWDTPYESVCNRVVVECTTAGSTDTTVNIQVGGVTQLSFTLGAGIKHLVLGQSDGANFGMPKDVPVTVTFAPGTGLADCTVSITYCPGTGPLAAPSPGG